MSKAKTYDLGAFRADQSTYYENVQKTVTPMDGGGVEILYTAQEKDESEYEEVFSEIIGPNGDLLDVTIIMQNLRYQSFTEEFGYQKPESPTLEEIAASVKAIAGSTKKIPETLDALSKKLATALKPKEQPEQVIETALEVTEPLKDMKIRSVTKQTRPFGGGELMEVTFVARGERPDVLLNFDEPIVAQIVNKDGLAVETSSVLAEAKKSIPSKFATQLAETIIREYGAKETSKFSGRGGRGS